MSCTCHESAQYSNQLLHSSLGIAADHQARRTVISSLDTHKADLHALSDYIHANPELGWEEVKAHAKLTSFLSSQGYTIENYDKYPTAFKVSYTRGSGGRVFGLNSEYDALPGLGHACGHNLIAICGVGAFLALRAAMDAHDIEGTIVLIGTPAEEGGSGKVHLYEIGACEY
jgi:metal-dependent amidase/aminoacylase/carboxypeptidase family protein